jgi:hypothetical protein
MRIGVVDEYRTAAFDEPAHSTIGGGHLNRTLDHLHGAAVLIDGDRERRALHDGGEHWCIDGEMRNPGVLDLEEHSAQFLDHAGETGCLRYRGESEFASWRNNDVIGPAHEHRASC